MTISRIGHASRRHHICPVCEYDLVATVCAGKRTCPECGYEFDLDELQRQLLPEDWTPARGLGRLLYALLVRGTASMILWIATLWVCDALIAALAPWLSAVAGSLVVLIVGCFVILCGSALGYFLSRGTSDIAGVLSWLVVVIVCIAAWISLSLGAWVAVVLAGVGPSPAFGAAGICGFITIVLVIRGRLLLDY